MTQNVDRPKRHVYMKVAGEGHNCERVMSPEHDSAITDPETRYLDPNELVFFIEL